MGLNTFGGFRVTSARVQLPAWGAWYADVEIDGEHTLSSTQTLKIADLALVGCVLSGGPEKGRSRYRVVGGKGGWGRELRSKSYSNDLGVKASTVITDAAREAGEEIAASTLPSSLVGLSFVRPEDAASHVLDLIAPRGWYVGEDGVTRIGARAAGTPPAKAVRISPVDLARGKLLLASESIATLLPGVVVDGLTAVDVEHSISAASGLRTTLWGARASGSSRGIDAFAKLLDTIDPDRAYRCVYEYRVVARSGSRLTLQPIRRSTGMPDLARVYVRPGVAGCEADVVPGARVLVGFIEADPGRPYVAAFEDADGGGFVPDVLRLGGGAQFVALANLVGSELSSIATALATHTHAGVTAGAGVTGTPPAPPYTAGSVAASRVKAT